MADLGNSKIKDTYQLVLQADASGNLQKLDGTTPNPFIVNGNLRYVDGNQANGYVLLSDASGNASWGAVVPGDIYISGGSINGTTIELNTTSGNTVSIPGLKWSANTDGSVSPSGDTTAVTLRDDINVVHGKTLNVDLNGSLGTTILFQSTQTYFQQDIKLGDNDKALFGADGDLQIYHNGSHGTVDNNTGNLYITSPNLYLGDTTSEVIAQDNLTVNDNLIVGDNITAGTDTFFVSATSGRTGIKTLSPDAILTVKGGLGFQIYDLGGGNVTFANGFNRVLFSNGASPANLSSGDEVKFSDGAETFTLTVDSVAGANMFLTENYVGSNVTITDEGLLFSSGEPLQFQTLGGSSPTFQVSGTSVMSGTTDLLDIFASSAITNQDVYWTATTDGTGISPSGSNVTTVVRMSGDTHIQGNLGVSGNTYTSGAFVVGNMSLANNQLDISSGDFTLDVEGDITLDANGADIILSDDGTDFGRFKRDSSDFIIKSEGNNNDIVFRGQDAGVTRDALLLDMSDAGTATFNNGVNISGVTSGRTDASFGGNLGISGKTFLDDHLRFSSAKQVEWVDSSTYIQGTTTLLALNGDLNITQSATNQIKMTSTEMTNVGRVGISGDTNINGVLSGLTDARFGGNLGVTGNTYFNGNISYPNARFFIQTTGAIKLLANNNWAGFNRTTGGLDSSGFWNVDTGSGTIGTAYNYYGSYRNTFFTVPYACKLTRMVIQGANTTNSEVGQDWNIHLAKSPVVDDSDSISWAAVTGVTKTLPDNRDKRFIYDISIDQNCSQFDTFFLAFQGTNSADTWLSMNVILEFEYTLT
tara:strand:+ start:855 stop:3299 length:2445 start_codon:yes stop_codon:yes gene_type:complete